MPATFNGSAIFGSAVEMTEEVVPAAVQETAYPQLNGIEALALGGRARMTMTRGILVAANGAALAALIQVFRTYEESGRAYTLVTTTGEPFPYCLMRGFKTVDRVFSYSGGVGQKYQVAFRHLR